MSDRKDRERPSVNLAEESEWHGIRGREETCQHCTDLPANETAARPPPPPPLRPIPKCADEWRLPRSSNTRMTLTASPSRRNRWAQSVAAVTSRARARGGLGDESELRPGHHRVALPATGPPLLGDGRQSCVFSATGAQLHPMPQKELRRPADSEDAPITNPENTTTSDDKN
ncbi:hypothetical protein AAFF_G00435450 [Aldrovandia affinis]|uniref:Uncharacterized protein n=1 Tax=Aldrovandia affinis TaxID=143900 RepID=A0AAD7WI36_9TELE|nr:hypothetical protein AAFF_G00435450 [Aldrovandia affinis]